MRNLYRSGEQHVANCFSGRTLQGLRPVRSGLPGAHHSPLGTVQPPGYEVMETEGRCTGCASCALMCPDVAIRVFKSKKTEKTA